VRQKRTFRNELLIIYSKTTFNNIINNFNHGYTCIDALMLKFNFSLANAVCCYNFNEITLHKFLNKVFNFKLKYNYSRAEL